MPKEIKGPRQPRPEPTEEPPMIGGDLKLFLDFMEQIENGQGIDSILESKNEKTSQSDKKDIANVKAQLATLGEPTDQQSPTTPQLRLLPKKAPRIEPT
jgi:hypothetical protein